MNRTGAVKKLLGAVILAAEAVMSWQSAKAISPELLPVWHKWSGRLTAGLFAAFLIVSAVLFFICVIREKARPVFVIWGGICLMFANTFFASPGWLQIVLTMALIIFMIHSGLMRTGASAVTVLVIFAVCAMLSIIFIPLISRIEKPELYTTLEGKWWDLFYTESSQGSSVSNTPPEEIPGLSAENSIPDNMITNDPFLENSMLPVCDIRSTYPLERVITFSCGNYDPMDFSFSIWDDPAGVIGDHSASASYFQPALDGTGNYAYKAVISDNRETKAMLPVPYCSFSAGTSGLYGFGDRFVFTNDADRSAYVQYSFDPESRYRSQTSGYSTLVQMEYLGLPDAFLNELRLFLSDHGLSSADTDANSKIAGVRSLLASEYVYSNTPPELPIGKDPVMWFITESKTGYSKHFAAAEVFLYRALGIPARYSFGYNVREYNDGVAHVVRSDAAAFCEVYANGAWMLPEEVAFSSEPSQIETIGPKTVTEVKVSDGPVILSNGYDISHLKGTASMFGSYEDSPDVDISRDAFDETDETVVMVIDTGMDVDYIKAYSTGDYNFPEGNFTIIADTASAPEFEEGKSFGEYAKGAFMSHQSPDGQPAAQGFRVFNLFAPRRIYSPVCTVSDEGLAKDAPEGFTMDADRMIKALSGIAVYDDYTLFAGTEPAGANNAYTQYALSKYTQVPDELLYSLRELLKENGIDPDSADKNALIEAVKTLLGSYTYTMQIEDIPEDEDPVLWFLTVSKSGYCHHFASAGTLLLRACGIPARFVSGYFRRIAAGSIAEITAKEAHAWTEVFDGRTWQLVEMCVGQPDEGQTLPAGLRTGEDLAYELPSVSRPDEGGRMVWVIYVLAAAVVCALAAGLVRLIRKNRPDMLQTAAIRYRYINKYFFISDDTERLLNKITFSKEGAEQGDLDALGKCVKDAGSLLLFRRKYLTYVLSRILYAFWYVKAVVKNCFSRNEGKTGT